MTAERALYWLTFASTISTILVGGVFFAFSNFIMPAFARVTQAEGLASMKAINVTVMNPAFMILLFGSALAGLLISAGAFMIPAPPGRWLLVVGSATYIVGCAIATMIFNVPINNALAAVQIGTEDAARVWAQLLSDWTFWNSVRTGASLLAGTMFLAALVNWRPANVVTGTTRDRLCNAAAAALRADPMGQVFEYESTRPRCPIPAFVVARPLA